MAKKTFEIEMKVRRNWFDEPRTKYEKHCLRMAERKYEGYFRRASEEGLDPEELQDVLKGIMDKLDRIEEGKSSRRRSAEWRVLHTLELILSDLLDELEPVMKEED